MPEPRPRTPAQIEASRRNGARSNGPVTAEGKARASRNALRHGLCAMRHLVLEDEVPDDLEALIAHMTEEVGAAPKIRPPEHGYKWEEADPLTTFDVRRFNAIRGAQAQIDREIRSCLKELRRLRQDALARTDEPDERSREEQNYTNDLSPCTFEPEGIARLAIGELRSLVESVLAEVARLRAENAALREEVARLKGLPPRPKLKPSGMEGEPAAGRAAFGQVRAQASARCQAGSPGGWRGARADGPRAGRVTLQGL